MKLILIFTSITKKKIKVDKNEHEYILFRIDVYFTEYFLVVGIDEQNHEGRELIFEKKRQEALEKKLGCKFIRVNASDDTDYEVNKVQIFISKFKRKNEIKIKQNKRTRKRNKIIKTSINKSKFISCQKMFYQITKNEKHTIKNKINKSWKKTWSNELFGV